MSTPITIFWFRRDLRLEDNAGLFHALNAAENVLPIFIFDKNILDKLSNKKDARVEFIHDAITKIHQQLADLGSSIEVIFDTPINAFETLLNKYNVSSVFTNHDYEFYGIERDRLIQEMLGSKGIEFTSFKDQVIFEKDEVTKDDGKPYTVFTPYSKKWKALLAIKGIQTFEIAPKHNSFIKIKPTNIPSLEDIGFVKSGIAFPVETADELIIKNYKEKRDIPSVAGTSKLGIHLRFGTVSVRKIATLANSLSETFLNEIIWRDFYHMISWQFPHVNQHRSFKPQYDEINWRNNEVEFEKWCAGQTGYPIVDAGMRELNETGFMHNRVRMIVASFLCKHLLIDWRWGEAYFAEKLLDFDFAANNGGWQWAAGSGCDAAPYFRIFNPYLQTQKFDPELKYIRKWVPEFQELTYPTPIVVHEFARKRCLEVYGDALKPTTN